MSKILITGATGNIGIEIINCFNGFSANKIVAAVRNIEKAKGIFHNNNELEFVNFDFENTDTFEKALNGIDRVFLLRPPHISDVEKYFRPLLLKIKQKGISEIVFLSVQGVESSKIIPHNKIERLINELGFNYIFLRPSYFMQNITTTLLDDIVKKREIILPARNAKFNWVDINNIAEIAAILLNNFSEYKNRAIEITGIENMNFANVVSIINANIKTPIKYRNVNPLRFYKIKKNDGMTKGMILVMIMLHFLPRFQKEPRISDFYKELTGKEPTSIREFIIREIRVLA